MLIRVGEETQGKILFRGFGGVEKGLWVFFFFSWREKKNKMITGPEERLSWQQKFEARYLPTPFQDRCRGGGEGEMGAVGWGVYQPASRSIPPAKAGSHLPSPSAALTS